MFHSTRDRFYIFQLQMIQDCLDNTDPRIGRPQVIPLLIDCSKEDLKGYLASHLQVRPCLEIPSDTSSTKYKDTVEKAIAACTGNDFALTYFTTTHRHYFHSKFCKKKTSHSNLRLIPK